MKPGLAKLRWRLKKLPSRFFYWIEDRYLNLLSNKFSHIETTAERKLPPHYYDFIDEYFQRFLNSKSHHGIVPNEQLMLVCGPESIGKTALIRKNLRVYAAKKTQVAVAHRKNYPSYKDSPYLDIFTNMEESMKVPDSQHFLKVELDFQQNSELTFSAFLHLLQEEILQNTLRMIAEIEKSGAKVLSPDIVIRILLEGKAPEYVLMYLKDHLTLVVEDAASELVDEQTKYVLSALLKYTKSVIQKEYKVFGFISKVVAALTNDKRSAVETALRLGLAVCSQIEYEYRPKQFTATYYRSGIESTDFLLDVMNFLAGFHALCLQELRRRLSYPKGYPSANYILSGNHVDCAIILFNLQCLDCFEHPDFLNWYDHLVLRVHNPSNIRTHIPIVLEVGQIERARDIVGLGHLGFNSPAIIEVYGYRYTTLTDNNIASVFSNKYIKWLWSFLGTHPTTWRKAIEKLASGYVEWPDIKSTEWLADPKRNIVIRSKINEVFASERTRGYLDEGLLRWRTAQQLEQLIRCGGLLSYEWEHVERQVTNDPIQKVLDDKGLTSASYYYDTYNLAYLTDLWELKRVHKQLTSRGWMDSLKYRWWKLFKNPISRYHMKFHRRVTYEAEVKYALYPHRRQSFPLHEYYFKKENFRLEVLDNHLLS